MSAGDSLPTEPSLRVYVKMPFRKSSVGTVTVLVLVFLLVNLLVDLLYGVLDPRISHD